MIDSSFLTSLAVLPPLSIFAQNYFLTMHILILYLTGNAIELWDVNFAGYCKHLGYKDFKVKGKTAYNLYCVDQNDQLVDVLVDHSATKACHWTWANSNVIARLLNFNDPNPKAWKCWW